MLMNEEVSMANISLQVIRLQVCCLLGVSAAQEQYNASGAPGSIIYFMSSKSVSVTTLKTNS